MSAQELITDHLDLWTSAVTHKSGTGHGSSGKIELTGIKKLRELILELAVRGKLVEQDPSDEPASMLLEHIAEEKARLVKEGKIKKPKKAWEVEKNKLIQLPETWRWVALGELVSIMDAGWSPSCHPEPAGENEWGVLKTTSIQVMSYFQQENKRLPEGKEPKRQYEINSGDILITRAGPKNRVGISCWVDKTRPKLMISDKIIRFQLIDAAMSEPFICLCLNAGLTSECLENAKSGMAVSQMNISQDKLKEAPIPLCPANEQHRIVEKVNELMALCDRLEQQVGDQLEAHEVLADTLLDALTRSSDATELGENWARVAEHFDTLFTTEASIDKLKQTILQLAVMGRLVEQKPNDEPASVLLEKIAEEKARLAKEGMVRKQKPLPKISDDEYPFEIPAGWVMSRMDDITEIQSGIAKGKKFSDKPTTWLPYLRVANVQRGRLDLSDVKEIEIACDEAERYSVKKRDLLITEGGDWDKVGRTAIWDAKIHPMAHQNHIFRARIVLDGQNEKWIEKYLNSGFARKYFASSSKQTTNLASINKTQLRSCTIPIPPLEEQQRIIEKVDELMALCDQLKTRLAEASETRAQLAETTVEQAVN